MAIAMQAIAARASGKRWPCLAGGSLAGGSLAGGSLAGGSLAVVKKLPEFFISCLLSRLLIMTSSDLETLLLHLTTVLGFGMLEARATAEAIVTAFVECEMETGNMNAAPAA